MMILVYLHTTRCLNFENETNWANNVLGLRRDYNLPLNDDNIKKMSVSHWKYFMKSALFKEALLQLHVVHSSNRKTNHISYQHSFLKTIKLPSHLDRSVFKAKTRMLGIKINYKRIKMKHDLHCPFCSEYDETFEHIFKCNAGLRISKQLKDFTLQSFSMAPSEKLLEKSGYFLGKYNKYRQEVK